jgi:asparagine synthase (glutamine-hydrolysing)
MCGISGIFEFNQARTIDRELVHKMNDALRHRGPDDEGILVDKGIGLGHRRLSIIDVAGGHQPISNEDGSIWVLLNGEIYNYPELSQDLQSRGHIFTTHSDTEAIVHLYEEYGDGCFSRLRGMFAIAIWDSRRHRLVLARDRVGKKPLYYFADRDRIIFGSELKAILTVPGVEPSTDPVAVSDYFSLGYIPAPKTIYKQIRKVMPAHHVVADRTGLRETEYWRLSFGDIKQHSENEWSEIIRDQLAEATRIRLMSEVPLGAFLSGGVDSSSIVALMSKAMDRPVTTCSIGFPVQEFDESSYARQVATEFHTDHHEDIVEPKALDVMDKLVWHFDEPFADSSAIPTFYVSQVARRYVTVALGGDGGDENFAGYRRYLFDYRENRIRDFVPAGLRRTVFAPMGRYYPGLSWAPRMFRAKATFQSLSRSPLEGYFNSVSIFRADEKQRLFTNDFRNGLDGYDSINVLRHYYDQADTMDPLSRIQYVDIKTYLPDDILTKVDRASMAVSLELRAPILDHKLMEMAASIPSGLKLHGDTGKYIFKKSLERILPANILYRSKQGFAIPLNRWFRKELKEMAYSAIMSHDDGILDRSYLSKMWKQHQSGTFDRSAYLWSVLMFRKWQETFQKQAMA